MERTKKSTKSLAAMQQVVGDLLNRIALGRKMGISYKGKRDVYKALGYPDETELDFTYYYGKYERQDIATTVIDKPVDKTWTGHIAITEPKATGEDSALNEAWQDLDEKLKIVYNLKRLDKLMGIGEFAALLYGFSDVNEQKDFKLPIKEGKLKLVYLKPLSEANITISEWEDQADNERYGLPKMYKIKLGITANANTANRPHQSKEIEVHWTRVLHAVGESLVSDVYGRPRLKPIVNRLVDLEKILGGDAEMFWRGARPGYTATNQKDYTLDQPEQDKLEDELDKYEMDLRRFINAQGVDIKALAQQVADPLNHVDIQIQAISAQTGIPKRILVGSERGELSSSQDTDAYLGMIKTRREEFAEPVLLRVFIDKLMEVGALNKVESYNVMWEDLFAPSDKDKVEVGKGRATALKTYADSTYAAEYMPPVVAYKHLLGLNEEQIEEVMQAVKEQELDDEKQAEQLEREIEAELARRQLQQPQNGNVIEQPAVEE